MFNCSCPVVGSIQGNGAGTFRQEIDGEVIGTGMISVVSVFPDLNDRRLGLIIYVDDLCRIVGRYIHFIIVADIYIRSAGSFFDSIGDPDCMFRIGEDRQVLPDSLPGFILAVIVHFAVQSDRQDVGPVDILCGLAVCVQFKSNGNTVYRCDGVSVFVLPELFGGSLTLQFVVCKDQVVRSDFCTDPPHIFHIAGDVFLTVLKLGRSILGTRIPAFFDLVKIDLIAALALVIRALPDDIMQGEVCMLIRDKRLAAFGVFRDKQGVFLSKIIAVDIADSIPGQVDQRRNVILTHCQGALSDDRIRIGICVIAACEGVCPFFPVYGEVEDFSFLHITPDDQLADLRCHCHIVGRWRVADDDIAVGTDAAALGFGFVPGDKHFRVHIGITGIAPEQHAAVRSGVIIRQKVLRYGITGLDAKIRMIVLIIYVGPVVIRAVHHLQGDFSFGTGIAAVTAIKQENIVRIVVFLIGVAEDRGTSAHIDREVYGFAVGDAATGPGVITGDQDIVQLQQAVGSAIAAAGIDINAAAAEFAPAGCVSGNVSGGYCRGTAALDINAATLGVGLIVRNGTAGHIQGAAIGKGALVRVSGSDVDTAAG